MSSVTEIETAIQKLSVAEQQAIALHLGARLRGEGQAEAGASADEGIRFLPQVASCPPPRDSRQKLRPHAKPDR